MEVRENTFVNHESFQTETRQYVIDLKVKSLRHSREWVLVDEGVWISPGGKAEPLGEMSSTAQDREADGLPTWLGGW